MGPLVLSTGMMARAQSTADEVETATRWWNDYPTRPVFFFLIRISKFGKFVKYADKTLTLLDHQTEHTGETFKAILFALCWFAGPLVTKYVFTFTKPCAPADPTPLIAMTVNCTVESCRNARLSQLQVENIRLWELCVCSRRDRPFSVMPYTIWATTRMALLPARFLRP